MKFEQWTAKGVEERIVEAAETLMLTPNVGGGGSIAWPDVVRSAEESYGYGTSWYKRRPEPGALDRMTETWGWINALGNEWDRKLLYAWAWVKARKGRSVAEFASNEGLNSKTLRRTITRICQRIADDLNQKHVAWVNSRVDRMSDFLAYEPTDSLPSMQPQSYTNHLMLTPDARPRYPTEAEIADLTKRIERGNRRRRKALPTESA